MFIKSYNPWYFRSVNKILDSLKISQDTLFRYVFSDRKPVDLLKMLRN